MSLLSGQVGQKAVKYRKYAAGRLSTTVNSPVVKRFDADQIGVLFILHASFLESILDVVKEKTAGGCGSEVLAVVSGIFEVV